MQSSFDISLPKLREDVEEALNLLEQQTYIQRNGECYEFLTDEEKDVEEEIKSTDADADEVAKNLDEIIYSTVIKDRKIRHNEYKIDYAYSRKLDDKLYGRDQELSLHIVSPFNEHFNQLTTLNAQSMGRAELLIVLPEDERLIRDLLMFERTDKYVRLNTKNNKQDSVKRILIDKNLQNQERKIELKQRIKSLLGKARLFIQGTELDIGGEDAESRIIKAFHGLVNRTYTNLPMLKGVNYQEKSLHSILRDDSDSLLEANSSSIDEAEQEILSFIQSKKREGIRTTVHTLLDRFERKPYGWPFASVLCILAKVFKRGKVDITKDSNPVEAGDLARLLTNSQAQTQLILEPQIEFTAGQVSKLKRFYGDFFHQPVSSSEAKALASECSEAFAKLAGDIQTCLLNKQKYSFLKALDEVLPLMQEMAGKSYAYFFTDLAKQQDDLLDAKEDIIDPILSFMNGQHLSIYDEASTYLNANRANLCYLEGDTVEKMEAVLKDEKCFKGNKIQQLKSLADELKSSVNELLTAQRSESVTTIKELEVRLCSMDEFAKLTAEQQASLTTPFKSFADSLQQEKVIAVIRDQIRGFEEGKYQNLLRQMCHLANPPEPTPIVKSSPGEKVEVREPAPKVEYVQGRQLKVNYNKALLSNEDDVNDYLKAMKNAFMQEIKSGKRVQI